ncbi:MAG: sodium:solute symporter family protein [Endomicrobiia bacterium]
MTEKFFTPITVGIYFSGMLFIGWFTSYKVKNLTDFLVAGRKLGFILATATMFATWFGAESVMGTAATVYKQGLKGVIADPFGASLALILAGLFYAVAFYKLKLLTVVEVFGLHYNKKLETFATLLMLPVYIGWLGAQIVAIGYIFSVFTQLPPNLGMILGTAVVLIYTLTGGMWAVTITDFFQMIILIVGIIAILPFVLKNAGGLIHILHSTPKEFFNFLPEKNTFSMWSTFLGKWFIIGLGCVVGQDLIQRSLSSKNEFVARWSAIVAGIIYFVLGIVIITIGLASRIILPDIETPELLIPILAKKFLFELHPFIFSIFICGLLAAIMSSADSSLLAGVSLFVNNIVYKNFPTLSEKTLLLLNRISTVIFTILSMFTALYIQQIYNLMVNSWATLLVAILVPSTVALFMKKYVNIYSGWISMISGIVVWLGYIFITTKKFVIDDTTMDYFYSASLFGFLASIFGYFISYNIIKLLKKFNKQ